MRNSNDDLERIEQLFREAKSALGQVGSARDQIERRIAATSVRKAPNIIAVGTIVAIVVLASVSFRWWHPGKTPPLPPGSSASHGSSLAAESRLETDDAELSEYVAAIIDHRNVVVIWTYRGQGLAATPSRAYQHLLGRYRLAASQERKLANGHTLVCSLLIPDAGVQPILEPPSIYACSEDNRAIALSVSPRAASAQELSDAIRSAGADVKTALAVEDSIRDIRKQDN